MANGLPRWLSHLTTSVNPLVHLFTWSTGQLPYSQEQARQSVCTEATVSAHLDPSKRQILAGKGQI
ncbi:hypothetical protein PHLCEN_2v13033 [Hermanssonia centrifuga]|uniref:Uncharacterized protein n=1 Tax=Hermanssonia centrifuga TaxID=98765 RepID=A0A2R6NFA2_9APHY|nr:hypothetical protein PHLCEN_2v13033 [Hermanssonia centrifuga]